jgi:hypothetical protein
MVRGRGWATGLLAVLLLLPGGTGAQSLSITVNPVMVKGAPSAPVTIVEFSDYQ